MAAPTVQQIALAVLRDGGILSLVPSTNQANVIRQSDIDATALCLSQAFQEAASVSGAELLAKPGSSYLRAPTSVTVTTTLGSTTISALTTYASWMLGCTIRISGDDQDNELLSSTLLARPYMGTSAVAIAATVYADCITLGSDVERVIGPMFLPQNRQVFEVTSRLEFMHRAGYPVFNGYNGSFGGTYPMPYAGYASSPFWCLGNKPIDTFPSVFFLDRYYDSTLDYVATRVRLSPMPSAAASISWTDKMTPLRVTSADIISGLTTLAATGASSDASVNQSYTYNCDVNGYRYFKGVSAAAYSIFFHPGLGTYIICSTLNAAATPTAYWTSNLGTSPLGTFSVGGTATGTVTVTTSDSGSGAADPGTKIPMTNGWVESIFLPIARQRAAGLPTFKNDTIRAEILRQYQLAINGIHDSRASSEPAKTGYI